MAKKTVAAALAALMAVGSLTACSSGGGETEAAADSGDDAAEDAGAADDGSEAAEGGSEAAEGGSEAANSGSGEPVTINFRYWADNTEYSQLMQDIVEKFNAENGKGITVVAEEALLDICNFHQAGG